MLRLLEWIGQRARWILALGAIAALFLQDIAAVLRPMLPGFVALMYLLAMVRIDLGAVFKRTFRPRRMAILLLCCAALMMGTPTLLAGLASVLHMPQELAESLIYLGAAPPLGSAAALCLLLGLDAALALELTIIGSFLTPFIGPFITGLLLGEAVPIAPLDLSLRLAAMIGAGAIAAVALRYLIGSEIITRRAKAFDGIGAVAMLLTVIPIFAGATAIILARPVFALGVLALVFLFNIGFQLLVTPLIRRWMARESAGSLGLVWGNRNAALYLAALPQAPVFTLFVAMYQFPMYMTPLLLNKFYQIK